MYLASRCAAPVAPLLGKQKGDLFEELGQAHLLLDHGYATIRLVPKPAAEFPAIWLMLGVIFVVPALALWRKR